MNERTTVRGVKLRDWNEGGWENYTNIICRSHSVAAETREHLQHIVNEFERVCNIMGMKINAGKSKVLVVKKDQRGSCE